MRNKNYYSNLRYLNFIMRYGKWFAHPDGIKRFTEQIMYFFIKSTIRLSHKLQDKQLLISRKELQKRKTTLEGQPSLSDHEYYAVHNHIKLVSSLVILLIIAETFLNYISTLVILPAAGFLFFVMRWMLAIALTGFAIAVADWFFHAVSPVEQENPKNIDQKNRRRLRLIGMIILLIIMEFIIMGIAHKRALDVEGGETGTWLYYGLILLSGALPIMVGYIRWDNSHKYNSYCVRHELNEINRKIEDIDKKITTIEKQKRVIFLEQVNKKWALLSEFRTYKEEYNRKNGLTNENMNQHYAQTKANFIEEAWRQYTQRLDEQQTQLPVRLNGKVKMEKIKGFKTLLLFFCLFNWSSCDTNQLTEQFTEQIERRNITCLVDYSGSVSDERLVEYVRIITEDIYLRLGQYDRLIVLPIDQGALTVPTKLFQEDLQKIAPFSRKTDGLTHARDSLEHRKLQYLQQHSLKLRQAILEHRAARSEFAKQTDILSGLKEVARLVETPEISKPNAFVSMISGEPVIEQKNILIIFSDMIHESDTYNFDANYDDTYIKDALTQLKNTSQIPQLSHTQVFVHGRSGNTNEQIEHLSYFWAQYFELAQADLISYDYDGRSAISEIFE